jgi:putative membrane protein
MLKPVLFTIMMAAASVPASAFAEGKGATGQQAQASQTKLSESDREFIEKAGQGGLLEVRLGQLAQQRTASPEVKRFAQRMVDDHSAINKRLGELAHRKDALVPQELAQKHREDVDKLSKKTGAEFDRDYMSAMVDDHQRDIEEFEKFSKEAKDADVKRFAASTLPQLQEHLAMAKQIHGKVKGK